jgi:predicted dehydrogenase
VVAAVKAGSPGMPRSATRVEAFAKRLRSEWQVRLVPDIADLCARVDGVLLLSVDGRQHLSQAREIIRRRRPLFIDKPIADTLADAREIARMAQQAGVLVWSSSSLRFSPEIVELARAASSGAVAWGPNTVEERFGLALAYEGIHAVEMLFRLFGGGFAGVRRVSGKAGDMLVARWSDGRQASVHFEAGLPFGAAAYQGGEWRTTPARVSSGYEQLLDAVIRSFRTGRAPVPLEETLEIMRFLDAAQQ